jgi:hypothetical protein
MPPMKPLAGGLARVAAAGLLVLGSCAPAVAQDGARIGLVLGYPSAAGFVWRVSDPVALRPTISFKNEHTDGPGALAIDSNDLQADLSVLVCVHRADALDVYIAPRISYLRTATDLNSSISLGQLSPFFGTLPIQASTEIKTTGYGAAGLVGAQYTLSRRFSVFAESGIAYSHTSHDEGLLVALGNSGTKVTNHSWSTTAAVGGIVWF